MKRALMTISLLAFIPGFVSASPSKHLLMLFNKAQGMVEKDKATEIKKLKLKAAEEIFNLEAKIKTTRLNLHDMILSGASDKDIKKTFQNLMSLETELKSTIFNYQLRIRDILGPEKFAELLKSLKPRKPHRHRMR